MYLWDKVTECHAQVMCMGWVTTQNLATRNNSVTAMTTTTPRSCWKATPDSNRDHEIQSSTDLTAIAKENTSARSHTELFDKCDIDSPSAFTLNQDHPGFCDSKYSIVAAGCSFWASTASKSNEFNARSQAIIDKWVALCLSGEHDFEFGYGAQRLGREFFSSQLSPVASYHVSVDHPYLVIGYQEFGTKCTAGWARSSPLC